MTNQDLDQLVKKWQWRLGLSDWIIKIKFGDMRSIDGTAQAFLQTHLQNADIRILQESDRQQTDIADNDIELDVVHELIHIRLWMQDELIESKKEGDAFIAILREQSVEWIARALVTTDRKNEDKKEPSSYLS